MLFKTLIKTLKHFFLSVGAVVLIATALFNNHAVRAENIPLPVYKAFLFSATKKSDGISIQFKIAPNYMLYKHKFEFLVDSPNIKSGKPVFPAALRKFDENFNHEVYYYKNNVTVFLPIPSYDEAFTLKVITQGCLENSICYPPNAFYYHVRSGNIGLVQNSINKNSNKITAQGNIPNYFKSANLDGIKNSTSNTSSMMNNIAVIDVNNLNPNSNLNINLDQELNTDKKPIKKPLAPNKERNIYWIFILICIICAIIISHPEFNSEESNK